jgi:ATP-dependent DNA helicase RecG
MPAARIAYRVLPSQNAPQGTRFSGRHLEGTVGEMLDQALLSLERDLQTFQVVGSDGQLRDELDVPREALREILSNALLHRSFTVMQETKTIAIEVSESAVVITSPGGLHVGADLERLGLDPITGVRNLSLVRICQQLTTPSGARIVENQASGIANADRACHAAGSMPALFLDLPDSFQVVLLRGALALDKAEQALQSRSVPLDPPLLRLVAVAYALDDAVSQLPSVPMARLALDARLAARALAPSTAEDAATLLRRLEDARVLERRASRHTPSWTVAPSILEGQGTPVTRLGRGRQSRIPDLLAAIQQSSSRRLSSSEIRAALDLSSPSSTNRWIRKALEEELIEPSSDNPTDPTRTYSLTRKGIGQLQGGRVS